MATLPTIDVSELVTPPSGEQADISPGLLEEIRTAFEEVGFAVIVGSAIPVAASHAIQRASAQFFALPPEEKNVGLPKRWNPEAANRYRGYFPDDVAGKQGLDLGDPRLSKAEVERLAKPYYEINRLTGQLDAEWWAVIDAYFDAVTTLGTRLSAAMVEALGGNPSKVEASLARPLAQSTLRFNAYPEKDVALDTQSSRPPLACEAHCDSGLLTLLHQDRGGGLQVRTRDAAWIDVPFVEDALIVNTGKAFERLCAGHYRATPHRVLETGRARTSIPFFLEPRFDLPITPSSVGLNPLDDDAPSYETFLTNTLQAFEEYIDR